MLPARRQAAALAARRWAVLRAQHSGSPRSGDASPASGTETGPSTSQTDAVPTGSAKLFADAEEEERLASITSARDHLRLNQGPIWTGDESTHDGVLRMLVDAHKPLRTGSGIKYNTADERIKSWMKNLTLEPKLGTAVPPPSQDVEMVSQTRPSTDEITDNPHRTKLPPHLHRPWHSTYTGHSQADETPKIKYGAFIKRRADADGLTNLLELQLPKGADGKTRARVREARKAGKMVRRVENAREGAIDYRLGMGPEESQLVEQGDGEEEGQTFRGNRQIRGSSVLGAQRGGASGLKAWAGLVEDRIQRAREAGFFQITNGKGKPIPRDPNAGNPHIESGELIMNRIVKRQGALPPWIELQNNLDSSLTVFRDTLFQTYTTNLVRTVISTNALHPLPPLHSIPSHDEAWEARERKFHEENVRQINDLVRRMNAQAPPIVRRGLITREHELEKIRGEKLRNAVWEEVKHRAEQSALATSRTPPGASSPYYLESEGLTNLKNATRRSLWTIAHPVQALTGKGNVGGVVDGPGTRSEGGPADAGSAGQQGSPRLGLLFVAGLGVVGFVYFRRPTKNDSSSNEDIIPPRKYKDPHERIVAASPAEQHKGVLHILRFWILEPFLTFIRFIHLALLFGPVILASPMLLVGKPEHRRRTGKPVSEEEDNWGAIWWYGFLVKQMERAGPSFIKLGQWAASRADLFPGALCDRMSKLHSSNDPHSFRHTRRVIEKAFGLKFDDIFEEFEETPIGCGAIAQVYRARLRPEVITGSPQTPPDPRHRGSEDDSQLSSSVAIKVLHPRVAKIVRRDVAIMSIFANILNVIPGMQWISLPEEVQVFGHMMNSQLDLRVEASNLDRFDHNFRPRGPRVTFPRPIKLGKNGNGEEREESKEVLIEEYEDALPLKYFLRNGGGPYDHKIANIGLDAFLEMLLLDNWTHGDLHPGNILVRFYKPHTADYFRPLIERFHKHETHNESQKPEDVLPHENPEETELVHTLSSIAHDRDQWLSRLDELNDQGYEPQLIFIDAGLVTSLDGRNRRNFLDLFQSVAEFDGYKAGKLMVERCRTPELVIDEETFALKMQHLILSVKSKTFSLAKIKISDILTDVLTAVRRHHVKLEGDFVNTVISILLLEGIGRQLDPDMDLFKSALPILRQLGRQLGTREAIAAVPKGNIWAMAKLWVWVEAREVVGEASAIDEWIKYDRLMPAV